MRNIASLVVLVLIVILVGGLIFLGIAKVREAAQMISCQRNLKQIGISTWSYQDANGAFPSAAIQNSDLPPEKRLSWMLMILPYVESTTISEKINKKKSWDAEENRFAALMAIKFFQCPNPVRLNYCCGA